MDFDELFEEIKASASESVKKRKQDEEARLKKEHDEISKNIKEAVATGKNSVNIDSYTSNVTLQKLKKHCTVTEIKGYNPSTHDDMLCGYSIKW